MSTSSTVLSNWEGAIVVKPKSAWQMLQCSNTRGYELLSAGELDSFLDGRSRKITVESIQRYIARQLELARSVKPPIQDHDGRDLSRPERAKTLKAKQGQPGSNRRRRRAPAVRENPA
jgi:hypothetical protein